MQSQSMENDALAIARKEVANPIGLDGMEFIEYASPNPAALEKFFEQLGLTLMARHKKKDVVLYRQNRINFVVNREQGSFADSFQNLHGPSVCATGFRVKDSQQAYESAIERGARPCEDPNQHSFPAIYGIGDSIIYFVEQGQQEEIYANDFEFIETEEKNSAGLFAIDHLTNNVPVGEMDKWADFYFDIFNFKQIRFFDIQGKETGLVSRALRSPCGKITVPINEPKDTKSQIQEYLDEYKGSGIQHLALTTPDICKTVHQLIANGIEFLDTPDTYYEKLPERMPNMSENVDELQKLRVLVDGDETGYLLQIFTKNVIGPVFFEIIQRKKHDGFGEGNFQALFDAIEEDQRRRGYL